MTVRDVSAVAQRLEMVRRIATEIAEYVVELGTDGRLLALQLDELIAGVEPERELVVRDYVPEPTAKRSRTVDRGAHELDALTHAELARTPHGRPRPGLHRLARGTGLGGVPARLPPAGEGAAAARSRSSTVSWSTSAACRSCSPRAWTTSRRWTASARPGRAASARACPGWRSPRSWSATSDRHAACGSASPPGARRAGRRRRRGRGRAGARSVVLEHERRLRLREAPAPSPRPGTCRPWPSRPAGWRTGGAGPAVPLHGVGEAARRAGTRYSRLPGSLGAVGGGPHGRRRTPE